MDSKYAVYKAKILGTAGYPYLAIRFFFMTDIPQLDMQFFLWMASDLE
jgi:hypothetical protein